MERIKSHAFILRRFLNRLISHPGQIHRVIAEILNLEGEEDRKAEHFWGLGLTADNVLKYVELISIGSTNRRLARPSEVFSSALRKNVDLLVLVHNMYGDKPVIFKEDVENAKR